MMTINVSVRDRIIVVGDESHWKLWGGLIALYNANGLMLSDCHHKTRTTADRLRGLLESFDVHTKSGDKVFYSTACGFYVWRERPAKNNCNKTVRFPQTVAESTLISTRDCCFGL
nr:MAG TPA: hypothetical protein [Caudoviricetes sp.]